LLTDCSCFAHPSPVFETEIDSNPATGRRSIEAEQKEDEAMRNEAIMERDRDGSLGTIPVLQARHEVLRLATSDRQQLLDITELVESVCTRARIGQGTVTVASRHTTAAIVVQENEPLLLQDLNRFLQRIAPENAHYCHNDMAARADVPPEERPNGHSHVRALLLPCSAQLVITGGRLDLGRWQRIFLAELDGPRQRQVSLMVTGAAADEGGAIRLVAEPNGEAS
jgi:secondary thiamine-phosphate synthase enzyme